MKQIFLFALMLSLLFLSCDKGAELESISKKSTALKNLCENYVATPSNHGSGTINSNSTSATIVVDTQYENGTVVYNVPAGFSYYVNFQIRKSGSPAAAKFTVDGVDYHATVSLQSYTVPVNHTNGFSASLHTITYGSYAKLELFNLSFSKRNCTEPVVVTPTWETIPLTAGLFEKVAPNPVTYPNRNGYLQIVDATTVKFITTENGMTNGLGGLKYQINGTAGYEYKLTFRMTYSLPHTVPGSGECGVYPEGKEFYSANNCSSSQIPLGCALGKVGESQTTSNVVYHEGTTIFTKLFTTYALFRIDAVANQSMTISNFKLERRRI